MTCEFVDIKMDWDMEDGWVSGVVFVLVALIETVSVHISNHGGFCC